MKRFVVTTTILSRSPGSTPSDVTYYRGENNAQALAALVSAACLQDEQDSNANSLPEHMKFDVTAVRMDIFDVEPEVKKDGLTYTLGEPVPAFNEPATRSSEEDQS